MAEYVLKYADGRGQIHQQVTNATSEKEVRDRFSQQGFLIYSIKTRSAAAASGGLFGRKKLNLEKFLIFNQQFVTLIRAGLPILKGLDLLAERLTDLSWGLISRRCATKSVTERSSRKPSASRAFFPRST